MTDNELYSLLENPEFFEENLLEAHSDHFFYETLTDTLKGEKMPLKQSLNGEWRFKYSKNIQSRPVDFYLPGAELDGFKSITVPANIELEGYGIPQYVNDNYPWDGSEELAPGEISRVDSPVGSYLRTFTLKEELEGKRIFISFQGVQSAFRLFINGNYVCYSEDSFTPAEAEITDLVKEGENVIAVEVYKCCSGTWLEDQDMWRMFGIFREVYLYAVPKAHLFDICAQTTFDYVGQKGKLDVLMEVWGNPARTVTELIDYNGNTIYSCEGTMLEKDGHLYAAVSDTIPGIYPWSGETPILYMLRVTLLDAFSTPVEYSTLMVGFRTFEMINNVMCLNGKRIVFRGVNRHEFDAFTGRAITDEDMVKDILHFKRNNINAVRTCHYPNQSKWYRLCDEYGIYMISETNLETHGTWEYSKSGKNHRPIPEGKPEWRENVLFRADNMLKTKRNHAAVLIWSLGNESFGGENFRYMYRYLKASDPTRLIHYEGVAHTPEYRDASDVETMMYAKAEHIRNYLSNNPDKPYILCEYMHAMGNSLGGMKFYTDLEDEFTMYQGGFIWDYIDQALYKKDGSNALCYGGDFGDRPNDGAFSGDGIIFADRTDSPKVCEVKNLYAPVALEVNEKTIIVKNKNFFTNLSDKYLLFTVECEGRKIFERKFDTIMCEPGQTAVLETGLEAELDKAYDYVLKASLREKESTPWCEAGYEISFAEKIILADFNPIAVISETDKNYRFIADTRKIKGMDTGSAKLQFSVFSPGPVSIKFDDREFLKDEPRPIFYRALTDNDKGTNFGKKTQFWRMFSLYMDNKLSFFGVENNVAKGVIDINSSLDPRMWVRMTYELFTDDSIRVNLSYHGLSDLPEIPLIGMEFKLIEELENVRYYGKGPWENYPDRNNGSSMGVYETTVNDNLTGYLRPQECGNRTGVRWIELTDKDGKGLLFATERGTMDVAVLPNSTAELENADHVSELPKRSATWLRLAVANTGVGGDDSWGAPVRDDFKPDPTKDYDFTFVIKKI